MVLPDFFADFPNLESLDLSGNELVSLPDSLQSLKSLSYLDLENNQFFDFPKCLKEIAGQLKGIYYDGNPIPPSEIINFTIRFFNNHDSK